MPKAIATGVKAAAESTEQEDKDDEEEEAHGLMDYESEIMPAKQEQENE
jgi:hypothetical protein